MSALSLQFATPLPAEAESMQKKSYVTYFLSSVPDPSSASPAMSAEDPHITLLENRSLISGSGTTGHRTWEAALHLGQYLCANPSIVKHKRVLELGAGTGYLSILCANYLASNHVIVSDGSDEVLNNLPDNFFLNQLQDSGRVTPMDIKWGHALVGTEEDKWNGGRAVDTVLGADITYDARVMPALIGTLRELYELYPQIEVYISATQRNEQTFQVFLDRCQLGGFAVEDLNFSIPCRREQNGPFYNDNVAIRICKVTRS